MPLNQSMILAFLSALVVSAVAIPPVVRVSRQKNLTAAPNGRTSHEGLVPTMGGVAVFAGFCIGAALFFDQKLSREFQYILPAIMILFFFGMKDDMVGLHPYKKLLGQILASACIILAANIRLTSLEGLFGIQEIPYGISIVVSLILFVGLINAFNLIDGIDGLASGLGMSIALVFGLMLFSVGLNNYAVMAFATAGSLLPFYFYNVFGKQFKLFMGDTGSQLLGLLFATLAVKLLCCPQSVKPFHDASGFAAVVMALMIIPITDTIRVMTIRITEGKSPFYADRRHVHHYLLMMGLTHYWASTIIVLTNFFIFSFAWILRDLNLLVLGLLVLGLGFIASSLPSILIDRKIVRVKKNLRKSAYHRQPAEELEKVTHLN